MIARRLPDSLFGYISNKLREAYRSSLGLKHTVLLFRREKKYHINLAYNIIRTKFFNKLSSINDIICIYFKQAALFYREHTLQAKSFVFYFYFIVENNPHLIKKLGFLFEAQTDSPHLDNPSAPVSEGKGACSPKGQVVESCLPVCLFCLCVWGLLKQKLLFPPFSYILWHFKRGGRF